MTLMRELGVSALQLERERGQLLELAQASSDFIAIADLDGAARFLNDAGQRLVGLDGLDAVRATHVVDYFPAEDRALVGEVILPLILHAGRWSGERFKGVEIRLRHFVTGATIPIFWDCFRLEDAATGRPLGLGTIARDMTAQRRSERDHVRLRRRQALVAELGLRALAGADQQTLIDDLVGAVARTLEVELVEVAELLPDGGTLLVRAGTGWGPEVVGTATSPAGDGSLAGYTLRTGMSIVVGDLAAERRFASDPLIRGHRAVSAITAVIPGRRGPFGALVALSTHAREFGDGDLSFLQAVADLLAATLQRGDGSQRYGELVPMLQRVGEQVRSAIAEVSEPEGALAAAPDRAPAARVLLVEDHVSFRELVAAALAREDDFGVVMQAGSLEEARPLLASADLAVVDLRLPDGSGADLIPELRAANPQAQAIVLSAATDQGRIAQAVERGAAAVIHKTAHFDSVIDALRRLRAGQTLMPLQDVVELLRFAGRQREREYADRRAIAQLTAREREVIAALADGLDSQQIADRLCIAVRTERNHMANVAAKLGVHSRLQVLLFALRYALVTVQAETDVASTEFLGRIA
ncbi:MAG: domain S-box protein [Conexibacter sp.]|nr:domain S-box protein [Conexibacter sp.]